MDGEEFVTEVTGVGDGTSSAPGITKHTTPSFPKNLFNFTFPR